jgi:predicted metal-dependent RNase
VAVDWGEARVTLYPAGHVLGAAQVLVETDFGRVLYTGDLKLRPGRTAEPAMAVSADVLILESTFGRPHYCFPDSDLVVEALIGWCLKTIDEGYVPVLLGYSLGKGQEILSALADRGLPIYLHPALRSVTDVYRSLGCTLPDYDELDGVVQTPAVVIAPPTAHRPALLKSIPSARTAALSGWAMDQSFKHRLEVDAVFPLSDHADFRELCAYALKVNAEVTYTVLGFDEELALHLRQRGLRALPLRQSQQLRLF